MKPEPYYPANGTDGDLFQSMNCDQCYKEKQCSILTNAMLGKYPKQWIINSEGKATCTSFNPNRPKAKKKVKINNEPNLF